jgi:hypothetical protein
MQGVTANDFRRNELDYNGADALLEWLTKSMAAIREIEAGIVTVDEWKARWRAERVANPDI